MRRQFLSVLERQCVPDQYALLCPSQIPVLMLAEDCRQLIAQSYFVDQYSLNVNKVEVLQICEKQEL